MNILSPQRRTKRGSSLVEVVLYVTFAGVILYFGVSALRSLKTGTDSRTDAGEIAVAAMNLNQHIITVARSATACRVPLIHALECDVPQIGSTLTKIWRFERVSRVTPSGDTVFVIHVSFDGSPVSDYPSAKYETGVDQVQFCRTARMAAGNCTLQPVKMNTIGGVIAVNSFFRYSFRMGNTGKKPLIKPQIYQSSFFLRNRNPVAGLKYEMGNE